MDLGLSEAILVPSQAVLKLQGSNERFVFLHSKGLAQRVAVKVGRRFDDEVELISDRIKAGDQLVVLGQARLRDGVKLNVID
jgi:multidrug efflux pump subunit AcrA (membrane-fusion protein)